MAGNRQIRRRWVVLALLAAVAGAAAWCYFGLYRPSRVDVQIADFLAEPNRRNAERLATSFLAGKGTEAEQSEILKLLAMPRVVTRYTYPADREIWIGLEPSPWQELPKPIPHVSVNLSSHGGWAQRAAAYGIVAGPDKLLGNEPYLGELGASYDYLSLGRGSYAPGSHTEALKMSGYVFLPDRQRWVWPNGRSGWKRWIPRREQGRSGIVGCNWELQVPLKIVAPDQGETVERLEGADTPTAVRKALRLEPPEVVYPPSGIPLPDAALSLVWDDMPVDCVFRITYRGLEGVHGPDYPTAVLLRAGSSGKVESFASPYQSRRWTPYSWFERPNTPDGYTGAIILTPDFETAWCFPEVKAICAKTIELPVKVTVAAPTAATRPAQSGKAE